MKSKYATAIIIAAFPYWNAANARVNDSFYSINVQLSSISRDLLSHVRGALDSHKSNDAECYEDIANDAQEISTHVGYLDTLQTILNSVKHEDDRSLIQILYERDLMDALIMVQGNRASINHNVAGECASSPLALQDGNAVIAVIDRMTSLNKSH